MEQYGIMLPDQFSCIQTHQVWPIIIVFTINTDIILGLLFSPWC